MRTIPTSAVPATTTEETDLADPSHRRSAHQARPRRHGPRLHRVAGNQSTADLSHAEWLALLLDREATERSNRQLTARLRHAKLRQRATIEDIDWRAPRDLDRTLFQRLIAGDWIDAPHNLIIEGPTGVGKSWLACALGNKACRDNRSVLYQRVPKLFPISPSPAATAAIAGS